MHTLPWTDSHCHLDAPEFAADRSAVVARARSAGVGMLVLPAVAVAHFDAVRELAHAHGCAYALGIHPLYVNAAHEDDLATLQAALLRHQGDPRLVAVGEIGLDHFEPGLDQAKAERFFAAQLRMAHALGLPVIVHVRRSADHLLKHLRRVPVSGIAHAFNGSDQQAHAFVQRGFKLGFGGAMTFERARQIRHLATTLPADSLVLETDAPDIPPHWLYTHAEQRAQGQPMGRNEPAELPRIAATLAELRGWTLAHTAEVCSANTRAALPKLCALADSPA